MQAFLEEIGLPREKGLQAAPSEMPPELTPVNFHSSMHMLPKTMGLLAEQAIVHLGAPACHPFRAMPEQTIP